MNENMISDIRAKIASDADFAASLRGAGSREDAIRVLNDNGFAISAEQLSARKLSSEELDSVAGGTLYCY
jgi:predicted ribosomally synthesized peptide with nif11-like leader